MARLGRVLALAVAAALVLVVVGIAVERGVGPLPDPDGCTVEVGDVKVDLSLEQAENAALISSTATRRGLPARAASIALATAYQESKLVNVDYGDRDSVGLFQQRPSQGWGTRQQLMDPAYATDAFYDALVEVEGYESMEITEAAQEVQRSAFPDAYADHEADGRALASALTGYSPHSFWCSTSSSADEESGELDASGLVPRAALVRDELEGAFGTLSLGGFQAGGVSTGHMEGSAHYDGRAIDVFFRPITDDNRRHGWEVASWLVANADRLAVETVIYDGRIWRSGSRSDSGWRTYEVPASTSGDRDVLEHRDHVHVDVAG